MIEFEPIGEVRSQFKQPVSPEEMREKESRIVLKPEYEPGLHRLEEYEYKVLFYLDKTKGYELKGKRHHGGVRGVFASRSPRRPNAIGLTTVELLEENEGELRVNGLDAVDRTPVLDLKPYVPDYDQAEAR